jgi:hypothetical protein
MPDLPPVSAWWLLLVYFLLAFAYFVVGFLPDRQLVGTDHLAAGYFFNEFISQRLAAGALPKWVPYVFGGLPIYSNPGGTYYPPRMLLALVLPPDRTIVALYVIQLTAAGIGTYLLLRALAVRWWVAGLAGLAYEFTGITLSFVYAGHDGRIIAATMLPVILLCVTRAIETGTSLWYVALSGAVAALLLSFQIQAAYYVLLAAAAWGVFILSTTSRRVDAQALTRRAATCTLAVGLAFAIAAVNFLPFAGYIAESPRANTSLRGYEYATSFSMPPSETIGLAVPEWQGVIDTYHGVSKFKYHTEYVGAFVVLLLLFGARLSWREKRWRFFAGMAVFALVMAWGGYTPLYRLYYKFLAGVSKFRAPSIGFFLVSFSLVMMAAFTLEKLATLRAEKGAGKVRSVTAFVAILGLVLSVGAAAGGTEAFLGLARFGATLALLAVLLWLWLGDVGSQRLTLIALAIVIVGDLSIIGRKFVATVDPPDLLLQPDDVAQFLIDKKPQRVWVFPAPPGTGSGYLGNRTFGVNTDYLMHFKLRQMGGEHGNQLQRWNEYVGGTAERMIDWNNLTARAGLVNAASVDYIVASVQLSVVKGKENAETGRLKEVYANDKILVYQNTNAMPRAYLSTVVHLLPTRRQALASVLAELWDPHDSTFVEVTPGEEPLVLDRTPLVGGALLESSDDPDRVVVRTSANRPAMLVLTEAYAEGWQARVDSTPVPIRPANYAFRGVVVPAGNHRVTFEFKPPAVYAGAKVSLAALIAVLAWLGWGVTAHRRTGRRLQSLADF